MWTIMVLDEIYDTGAFTEDGAPLEGAQYLVIAENPRGVRMIGHSFFGHVEYDEQDGVAWYDDAEAKAGAEACAARLRALTPRERDLEVAEWDRWHSVYGSPAWDRIDEANLKSLD